MAKFKRRLNKSIAKNSIYRMRFIMKGIEDLCCNPQGMYAYVDETNKVFKDLFLVKNYVNKLTNCDNVVDGLEVMNEVGEDILFKLFNTPKYVKLLKSLVSLLADFDAVEDDVDRYEKKKKKVPSKVKSEYKYLRRTYFKAINALKKVLDVERTEAYKQRYAEVRQFIKSKNPGSKYKRDKKSFLSDIDIDDYFEEEEGFFDPLFNEGYNNYDVDDDDDEEDFFEKNDNLYEEFLAAEKAKAVSKKKPKKPKESKTSNLYDKTDLSFLDMLRIIDRYAAKTRPEEYARVFGKRKPAPAPRQESPEFEIDDEDMTKFMNSYRKAASNNDDSIESAKKKYNPNEYEYFEDVYGDPADIDWSDDGEIIDDDDDIEEDEEILDDDDNSTNSIEESLDNINSNIGMLTNQISSLTKIVKNVSILTDQLNDRIDEIENDIYAEVSNALDDDDEDEIIDDNTVNDSNYKINTGGNNAKFKPASNTKIATQK